jgi:molybdenum-dependent DNA-binding transcriptional regulator ModE
MMMTDRATRLLKLLKRMLKQEHLYTDDQIKEIKNNIRSVEEEINRLKVETSKGFKKQ